MKRMTQKSLRNFAESLTEAIEEVAEKIGTIESIINGEGDEAETEDDVSTEDEVVEEPATEETAVSEEPAADEEPVVTEEETVGEEAPVEEPAITEESTTEQFSESSNRYQTVKDFLSRN